ncbi:hypothetical protein NUACC21_02050 [Scytonema sp. NUACC21]
MAEISAKIVQELRQKTGAGMMDCKKALQQTDGDIEKAIEWLRQKGIAKAEKGAGRIAAEGLVDNYIQPGGQVGVVIEVNCQTDFVARNDSFKALVQNLAKQAATADSVESLLTQPYIQDESIKVEDFLKQTIAQLGENIQVRRFSKFALAEGTQGVIDSYIHTGGRVGVLVELTSQSESAAATEQLQALARNVAMQIAACPNVEYVNVDEIPGDVVQKEKNIEMGRDDLGNKPQNIKEKIVQGRIEKREFWMVEPEMAFCDLKGDMDLAEACLKHIFKYVMETCAEDMEFFNQRIDNTVLATADNIINNEFERVTYTEAIKLLEKADVKFEYPVSWGLDLQSEHERYLSEQLFKKPTIVTNYPAQIKAFYMRLDEDEKTVAAMDILAPKIGEIIGGSQREERLDVLERRIQAQGMKPEDLWWYLDLRRFGTVPHAGFGLGFERLVQFMTGMGNIRDVIPFPRTPESAEF